MSIVDDLKLAETNISATAASGVQSIKDQVAAAIADITAQVAALDSLMTTAKATRDQLSVALDNLRAFDPGYVPPKPEKALFE